ncbi:MAG: gliding motility-associated C-terminal domain-containing protein [Saprospirales bacterium]|nr:gliding motility-associated C-terminal domain-containing protein [Saprospirales bacterium]
MDSILRNRNGQQLIFGTVDISRNSPGCNDTTEIRTITTQNCCSTKYTLLKDTICNGEQVIFNNQILKNTGTYYDTFVSNGNDSIVILELIVFNKSYQIKTLNFCIGQSFTLSNGRTITATGIYKDTIPNFCDSIIEYRLIFLNNIIVNQNATICQGKTYTLPKGNIVQTTGIYKDTLRSAFNCDSIVTTNLTVTKPIPFVNNVTICKGKNYVLPNGNSVNNAGTYYDTIRKPNTCDSIVITNLIVNPYLQSSQTATTCLGKTYTLPSGKTVTQAGIYKDTIRTITGCDSIVTTNLSIANPTPTQISDSICEGKIYTLPSGKQVTNTGVYVDTIKITNTCDSVIITNLSVFQNTFSVTLKSIDTIDAGNAIELKPMYSNQTAIIWNWSPTSNLNCTTCEKPIATPSQNTQYSLKATAQNGCDDTAKTTIIVRQTEVYIPTAFSPNNDGINDDLTVFVNNPVAFHLVIFNRYDQKVFESVDVLNKWNGTYKNAECEVDNYVYVLDVTTANGKQHHKQGTITLLR